MSEYTQECRDAIIELEQRFGIELVSIEHHELVQRAHAALIEENARLNRDKKALFDALDCLVAIVGLTAFKHEGQRAVLQEALDATQIVLKAHRADFQKEGT